MELLWTAITNVWLIRCVAQAAAPAVPSAADWQPITLAQEATGAKPYTASGDVQTRAGQEAVVQQERDVEARHHCAEPASDEALPGLVRADGQKGPVPEHLAAQEQFLCFRRPLRLFCLPGLIQMHLLGA